MPYVHTARQEGSLCYFSTKPLFKENHSALGPIEKKASVSIAIGQLQLSDLPLPDRHLSASISSSGWLCLHVVPITLDRGPADPGDSGSSQARDHLGLYVPCYDKLMALVTVWQRGRDRGRIMSSEKICCGSHVH